MLDVQIEALNKVLMEDFKQWAQQHLHTGSCDSRKLSIQVYFLKQLRRAGLPTN